MKKVLCPLFALLIVLSLSTAAFAADYSAEESANALYELGLFQGTGETANGKPIYSLDAAPTRALGYSSESDFQWDKANAFSDSLGLTHGEYRASRSFTRGDTARISYAALAQARKDSSETLAAHAGRDRAGQLSGD